MQTPVRSLHPIAFLILVAAASLALFTPTRAEANTSEITAPSNGSTLYTPGATLSSVTFTWPTVSGGTNYYLWVGTAPYTSDVRNTGWCGCTSTTLNATNWLKPLVPGTYYVTLWTASGTVWTNSTSTFTVAATPTGTLTAPSNGAALYTPTGTLTFPWAPVSGATGYYLYVGTAPLTHDIRNTGWFTGTSTTVTTSLAPGTYYVTLWTESAAPHLGVSTSTFTVSAPPLATLTTPANGSTVYVNTPIVFQWSPVAGAIDYTLDVSDKACEDSDKVYTGEVGYTSFGLQAGLPAGTYYATLWTKSNAPTHFNESCTIFTVGPQTGGGFWLPFTETSTGAGGTTGLGVVSSTLSSNALTSVTTTAATPITEVLSLTFSTGKLLSFSPYGTVYAAVGTDGSAHLYLVGLTDTSTTPVPQQMSSLSFAASLLSNIGDGNCVSEFYQNVRDPTSVFLILELPSTGPCSTTADATNPYYLIHVSDTVATAPVTLPASVTTTKAAANYSAATGLLTGLVLVDSASNLNWYPANGSTSIVNFAAPTTVASGVTFQGHLSIDTDRAGNVLTPGTLVFSNVQNGSKSVVYRIDSTGTSKLVYTANGTIDGAQLSDGTDVHDNTNIYFYDAVGSSVAPTSVTFVALPISGAAPTTLYTTSCAPPCAYLSYKLVDSDGKYLIFQAEVESSTTSNNLVTLSTSTANQASPTTLVTGTLTNQFYAFLDYASDHLFVNQVGTTFSSAVYAPSTSSTPKSGVGGANTYFSSFSVLQHVGSLGSQGTVLEFTNMPTSGATFAGASLYTMNATSLTATQVMQSGSPYQVPAGISGVGLAPVSPTIGIGQTNTAQGALSGVAIDASKSTIITLTLPSTAVSPF